MAAALAPLLAAIGLALLISEWWPFALAALMVGVGVVADLAYDRLVSYQPGWLALPLGAAELGLVMLAARATDVNASLVAALAFFVGSWLLAQVLGHAVFPLLRLTYGEDGGELGRLGVVSATAVFVVVVGGGAIAWSTQPPTIRLEAGVYDGPLVLDHAQKLVGEPGTIVRGGIVVTADDVVVRDLTVVAEENGIEVDDAKNVVLESVEISGASLDAINVRRSSVRISDCLIHSPADKYAQGIDISFSIHRSPSLVEGCVIVGGYEGIVTHSALVEIRENRVRDTTLRGISITEMSMGSAKENDVRNGLGVGIYCGDYSHCLIERNVISGTRPDLESSNGTRMGYGILSTFGAQATLRDNELTENHRRTRAFADAMIYRVD
ncbi:MAG: right-handed parallel beta-helix repeat-containing protein [Gaiellaceae bacterium]